MSKCTPDATRQKISDSMRRHGGYVGRKATPTYSSWSAMRNRCLNPNHPGFKNYGGRGITVCERWSDFALFLADMGERPAGLQLDRIDNSKGYSPDNCRWTTQAENLNNRRSNVMLEFAGQRLNVTQAAKLRGINPVTLRLRLRRGWSLDRALVPPCA
jgi:hypothetical protein